MKPTCRVIREQRRVGEYAHSLGSAIQRLKRDRRQCATCAQRYDCPTAEMLNSAILNAIRSAVEAWESM